MTAKKILLVDDSSTVIMMHRMALAKTGCELVVARNGAEAVEKAIAEHPDVILMDVTMPGMTGFEACRALRARPETEHTPIIMVTTRGEPHNLEEGYQAGCTDYVTKPFDVLELLAKLKPHLEG